MRTIGICLFVCYTSSLSSHSFVSACAFLLLILITFYVLVCLLELLEIQGQVKEAVRKVWEYFFARRQFVSLVRLDRIIPGFFLRFVEFPYHELYICCQLSECVFVCILVTTAVKLPLPRFSSFSVLFRLLSFQLLSLHSIHRRHCIRINVCVQYDFIPKQKTQEPKPKNMENNLNLKELLSDLCVYFAQITLCRLDPIDESS